MRIRIRIEEPLFSALIEKIPKSAFGHQKLLHP